MNKNFKKVACIAALSLMPMLAFANTGDKDLSENGGGLFLGLDTGYTFNFAKFQLKEANGNGEITTLSSLFGANVGVKAGYNFYFTSMFGVRGYLDYTFIFAPSDTTSTTNTTSSSTSIFNSANLITLNADLLVNLMQTDSIKFGAFVGIGLGYGIGSGTSTTNGTETQVFEASGFILPINLGLSLTANNHHRFELGFKVPTLGLSVKRANEKEIPSNAFETNSIRLFTTSVGYSYIF